MAKKILGRVTMQFIQHETDGMWYCEVKSPRIYSKNKRDTIKMALVTAVIQDHVNKALSNIDRMVMNNAEIAQYESMRVEEQKNKPKGVVDIDKYQQPLPFGEKSNDTPGDN